MIRTCPHTLSAVADPGGGGAAGGAPPPLFGQATPIFLISSPQTAITSDLPPPPPLHPKILDPPLECGVHWMGGGNETKISIINMSVMISTLKELYAWVDVGVILSIMPKY